jgi:hypothetical protein
VWPLTRPTRDPYLEPRSLHGFNRAKDRQVMAFGNFYDDLFCSTLTSEVLGQFLTQEASMGSNNAVLTRVISRGPSKNMNPDLLLCGFVRSVANRALSHVEQKIPKSRR